MSGDSAVVVAATSDPVAANLWLNELRAAGVEAAVMEQGHGAALGARGLPLLTSYAVLVPRRELARARSLIAELGGAAFLAPVPADDGAFRRRALLFLGAAGLALFAGAVLAALR